MPDALSPAQSGVIDQLIEQHGEGETVAKDEQGVVFSTSDRSWQIAEDGTTTELDTSAGLGGEVDSAGPETSSTRRGDEGRQADSGEASAPESPASTSTALAPQDQRVYQALTAADERQIIAEIEGRALDAMVYSFRQGGSTVTGLSWKGIQEAVRQMNTRQMGRIKIDAQPPVYEEVMVTVDTGKYDDDGQPVTEQRRAVRVTVYGIDEIYGSGRYGTATQTRQYKASKKTDKNGNPMWFSDPFADAKALSKAQRNALEGMLPLELVEELKALYLGKGKVEYIDSTAVDVTEMPPALDDPEAKELQDKLRELYAEFKRAHPDGMRAMPPAEFNRYMVAAQHDHDRLRDFKAHMEQRVAEAQEKKS